MKIFEGLKAGEAIDIGNGSLVVCLNGRYKLNETDLDFLYNKQIVVPNGGQLFKVVEGSKEVTGYITEDGDTFSVEEYQYAQKVLGTYYNEDTDEYEFPNLDVEFEVRKSVDTILNKTKPVINTKEPSLFEFTPKIVGVWEDTGSDFIETPYQVGQAYFNSEGAIYKVLMSDIARDAVESFLAKTTFNLKMDNNLKWSKINGDYFMLHFENELWCKSSSYVRLTNNLQQAKDLESELRDKINTHLQTITSYKPLSALERSETYKGLLSVLDKVKALDVKVKDKGSKTYITKCLQDLINKISKEVSNETHQR